jgi:glycosyltransferase involved in cell wall biosynthesis
MTGPFSFPPRPRDRLLAPFAAAEAAARALAGAVRRGELPRRAHLPALDRGAGPDAAAGAVLYLPALPWAFRYQRPQQLAAALAAGGRPVLYVDPFGRGRLQHTRPLERLAGTLYRLRVALPGRPDPYRELLSPPAAQALARTLAAGVGTATALVVTQLPSWHPIGRALRDLLGCPLVYDRIDLHAGFPGVPAAITAEEDELIATADLVTVSSRQLGDRPRASGRRVLELPNAVAIDDFDLRATPPARPADRLRVGYVGALHAWFDAPAVALAAGSMPGWELVLAGRVEDAEVAALRRHPNLRLAGEIPYRRVAGFLATLDVALIPFRDLPLTRMVDPVKLYEAMAVGVPVVARRLPEMERWGPPLVYTYEDGTEMASQIRRAAAEDGEYLRRRRRELAGRHTWSRRAAHLLAAVAGGT